MKPFLPNFVMLENVSVVLVVLAMMRQKPGGNGSRSYWLLFLFVVAMFASMCFMFYLAKFLGLIH